MSLKPFNASILVLDATTGERASGPFGALVEDGKIVRCSEHSAGKDPRGALAWLAERYADHGWTFKLVMDDAEAYQIDLHRALFEGLCFKAKRPERKCYCATCVKERTDV